MSKLLLSLLIVLSLGVCACVVHHPPDGRDGNDSRHDHRRDDNDNRHDQRHDDDRRDHGSDGRN